MQKKTWKEWDKILKARGLTIGDIKHPKTEKALSTQKNLILLALKDNPCGSVACGLGLTSGYIRKVQDQNKTALEIPIKTLPYNRVLMVVR